MNPSPIRSMLLAGAICAFLVPTGPAAADDECGMEPCELWDAFFLGAQGLPIFTFSPSQETRSIDASPPVGKYIDLKTGIVYFYDGSGLAMEGASLPPLGYVAVDVHPRGTYPTLLSGGADLVSQKGQACQRDVCASFIVSITGSYDVELVLRAHGVCDPRPKVLREIVPASGLPVTFVSAAFELDRCGRGFASAEIQIGPERERWAADAGTYGDASCEDPIHCPGLHQKLKALVAFSKEAVEDPEVTL